MSSSSYVEIKSKYYVAVVDDVVDRSYFLSSMQ